MSRVYTKLGDQGFSSLADGCKVHKSHLRLEAYGTIDELSSSLGLLYSLIDKETKEQSGEELKSILKPIDRVQNWLFALSSEIAHPNYDLARNKSLLIEACHTKLLEQEIDIWDQSLEPLRNFLIPGSHILSSYAHLSRTICRRAERFIVQLHQADEARKEVLALINRLSDWLFVLARYLDKLTGVQEKLWVSENLLNGD